MRRSASSCTSKTTLRTRAPHGCTRRPVCTPCRGQRSRTNAGLGSRSRASPRRVHKPPSHRGPPAVAVPAVGLGSLSGTRGSRDETRGRPPRSGGEAPHPPTMLCGGPLPAMDAPKYTRHRPCALENAPPPPPPAHFTHTLGLCCWPLHPSRAHSRCTMATTPSDPSGPLGSAVHSAGGLVAFCGPLGTVHIFTKPDTLCDVCGHRLSARISEVVGALRCGGLGAAVGRDVLGGPP